MFCGLGLLGLTNLRRSLALSTISQQVAVDLEYARSLALANSQDTNIEFSKKVYSCFQKDSLLFQKNSSNKNISFNQIRLAIKANGNPKYAGTVYIYWKDTSYYKVTLPPGVGVINAKKI